MTLPGWGRKVLLLAIIPVPLDVRIHEINRNRPSWPTTTNSCIVYRPRSGWRIRYRDGRLNQMLYVLICFNIYPAYFNVKIIHNTTLIGPTIS